MGKRDFQTNVQNGNCEISDSSKYLKIFEIAIDLVSLLVYNFSRMIELSCYTNEPKQDEKQSTSNIISKWFR